MAANARKTTAETLDVHTGPTAAVAGAILTVDLGAVRENYRTLRAKLGNTPCAAVVKANGYGLGAGEVSRALMREGCDVFFVAHQSEGQALREAIGAVPVIY